LQPKNLKQLARSKDDEPELKRKAQDEKISRKASGNPNPGANVQADIEQAMSNGSPLPLSLRRFMEPRFGADFSGIKIHTDSISAKLNRRLNARAFAYSKHIFGENQFKPDSDEGKRLIAHELTHTIQQGAASQCVAKKAETSNKVKQKSQPMVQRLGIDDALDYFAGRAHLIPGFRMLSILLGVNPITGNRVERSAVNILRAVVEFLPGGTMITTVLDRYGVFERASNFMSEQLNALAITGVSIRASLNAFLDGLSWSDILDLAAVWERAKRVLTEPISNIISAARSAFTTLLHMIKDTILMPLAQWASRTRGWGLLIAVLGRNPITGELVERTPESLIGGFMKLIGKEEVWENIKRTNAIGRAWAWFQGALAGIWAYVGSIPQALRQALEALQVSDLLSIPAIFGRIIGAFSNFLLTFIQWAGAQVFDLLTIIFEVVAPGLMPYLRRARTAFINIVKNPVGFVRNLIRAGVMGFKQFALRLLTHLKAGFINWLTGSLAGIGVYIPKSFSFKEMLNFILSVLWLTWKNIRLKLVKSVGERSVAAMERGFQIVKNIVTEGPVALWEQIKAELTNLMEQVSERVMNFVLTRIVQTAIVRIVSLLNPAGAFVQAIMAIYNTVMFFVERMRGLAQVARTFLASFKDITVGKLKPAAVGIENTMAGLLTPSINFLARLMGLGDVGKHIQKQLTCIRAPIDKAIKSAVNWVVLKARRVGKFIRDAK
jgi:hypothetical protein